MFDREQFIRGFLVAFCLLSFAGCSSTPSKVTGPTAFALAGAQVSGTQDLSGDDVLRGLNLHVGERTTQDGLRAVCDHLVSLKVLYALSCSSRAEGSAIWLEVTVKSEPEPPLIFDNFVWTTRTALITRLKKELPLLTPEIPYESTLTPEILRVLNQVVAERGIKGSVEQSRFWANRIGNVFVVNGISVPVISCQIEGENAPSAAVVQAWSHANKDWELSLAGLNWRLGSAIQDLYYSRGYLHPVVQEPVIKYLGESQGRFPVNVVLRISSGPQYTFKSVHFEGHAKSYARTLISQWKLKPGDEYNDSYTSDFEFEKILNQPWAQKDSTSSLESSSCVEIDESGRTVSLTITVGKPSKSKRDSQRIPQCAEMRQSFYFPGNFVEGEVSGT